VLNCSIVEKCGRERQVVDRSNSRSQCRQQEVGDCFPTYLGLGLDTATVSFSLVGTTRNAIRIFLGGFVKPRVLGAVFGVAIYLRGVSRGWR